MFPADFLSSIFVPIPKKTGAVDCAHFRTISLIGHSCKILLNIIHTRIKAKIDVELFDKQCGFYFWPEDDWGLRPLDATGYLHRIHRF